MIPNPTPMPHRFIRSPYPADPATCFVCGQHSTNPAHHLNPRSPQ